MLNNNLVTSGVDYTGDLGAVLIRADGTHRVANIGQLKSRSMWSDLWRKLKVKKLIPAGMSLVLFMAAYAAPAGHAALLNLMAGGGLFGLVSTAGVNFLATDMASGQASPRISSMNFHDSGTGTTAAATGDTTLQTQAGPTTRATGTQTNPSSGQYRSVGTIAYVSTLAITEWGIFNQAAQGGTLWDHRIFSAINVVSGDSIQYTYTLTVNAGGS